MRILNLDLLAFGPFTDLSLDFSQGDFGLQIVYGPNEAGKSSALRSIDAALFGIDVRSTDNFIHDHKRMRIGCHLENQAGERLMFQRRKGRTKTLLNAASNQALPDNALAPFLGNLDQEAFGRVFGINHVELRRGGDELLRLKGLVGESLFAASLGGGNLAQVLEKLDSEAAALYASRGSKSTIKQSLAELKAVRDERKQAEMSTSRWESLRKELHAADQSHQKIVEQLADQRRQKSRLQRIRKSLKLIRERTELIERLQELCQVTVLPESYSAERRSQCEGERGPLLARIQALTAEIDGTDGLREQIRSIAVPEGILDQKRVVEKLRNRLGAHEKAMLDRDQNLRPQRAVLEKRIGRLLRDLDLQREEVGQMRITTEKKALLQDLTSAEQSVRGLPDQLSKEVEQLTAELEALQAANDEMGVGQDVRSLRQAYENATKSADLVDDLRDRAQGVQSLEADAERRLSALGMWRGTLAELMVLPVPLVATVDRFDEQIREGDDVLGQLQEKHRALMDERQQIQLQIEEDSHRHGSVAGEQDLDLIRKDREELWRQIRVRWLGADSDRTIAVENVDDEVLAAEFQQAQSNADEVVDKMRAEAERVALLEQRRHRLAAIERELPGLDSRIAAAQDQCERIQANWRTEWVAAGIENPKTPREMCAWLDRHAALMQLAAKLADERNHLERLNVRLMAAVGMLRDALNEAGIAPETWPAAEPSALAALLQHAQCGLAQATELEQRRAEALRDLKRIRKSVTVKVEEREAAAKNRDQWEKQWRRAMQELRCAGDATARQANARINRLEELFRDLEELEDLVDRDDAINRDAESFERDITSLADAFGIAKKGRSLPRLAESLFNTFEQARDDQTRLDQLQARLERCLAELEEARRRETELSSELEQFCGLAGVESVDQLAEVERNSRNVVSREQRLKEIELALLDLGDGLTIEQLQQDARDQDTDALVARIEEIESTIVELESQRDVSAGNVRNLEVERSRAGGGSAAAEADQRMLGILSKTHDDGRRYLQLRLAATVLRNQVERYRAENQDPLLSRASDLFSRVTRDEFTGFSADYDDRDQPVLAGIRQREKEKVHVGQMSDGTRDQAYLSLRLAYLEWRLEQHESIPFIVDDLLIHFDDTRSLATLQVLAELSQRTQVIFFTHHRHLVELAESSLDAKHLFVHQLPGRSTETRKLAVAGSRPR